MKTADVELKAPEKPKGGLGALFGMSEAKKEKAPKLQGRHPSIGRRRGGGEDQGQPVDR